MNTSQPDLAVPANWKTYLWLGFKFLIIFYIATFCLMIFLLHRGEGWLLQGIVMGMLYLFVLIVSLKQLISKLPIAVLILAAPIVPLFMLFMIISMIPLL